ncbi:hypothetical protein M5D96_012806 [Drosophila gunungcola]|uniref:Serpin domain-containing protein n=1 Tax=Drosophila gunungcola TaxID=103775 RepID=A0A9P9YCI6_9MUSC|nr:hypothetical protein M5D96_012806 [Drosophila gunungcola]
MDSGREYVKLVTFWTKGFNISSEMQVILVNEVEFRGLWKHNFERIKTRKSKFHPANVYGLADLPELDATALELPFNDSATSMLILLANQLDGLANLEQQLAQPEFDLNRIANRLHRQSVTFSAFSDIDMTDALKMLGLRQMFTDSSKVTKLLEQTVRVDKILHRAYIDVSELGTFMSGHCLPIRRSSSLIGHSSLPSALPTQCC